MITIIYSTHKDSEYNNKFKQHLLHTVGLKDVQILEYQNNNQYSLSQVYNSGITESIYNIVVCCHNDIKLEKNWGKKLLTDFSNNPDFGIIGKAGSCYFPESGIYWEKMHQTMVGQVYHHPEGQNKWLNKYSEKLPFLIPVVTIDGLFISFDKTKITHKFDESFGKFHFYDHGFCLPNYVNNVKIGVTSSFEITHQSVGQPNQEFFESKEKFLIRWGKILPVELKPTSVYCEVIKEKPFKKVGKIAVIIPTKGKVEMLFECVQSFFDNCNKEYFDVFIADTGSSEEEKNQIKNKISDLNNVKLIEYDYYNFAKINNDIVKNHIDEKYEFLLFCNNDIKLLNNVLYEMLKVYQTNNRVGTVGARLHFRDNTVQHNGIILFYSNRLNEINVSHLGLKSYYNYNKNTIEVIGNTGALLLIKRDIFIKCGMFNELYTSCLEDVELNLQCVISGYKNFMVGNAVSYHYESQTRNEDSEDLKKLQYDFNNTLLPFVMKNINKLKEKISIIN